MWSADKICHPFLVINFNLFLLKLIILMKKNLRNRANSIYIKPRFIYSLNINLNFILKYEYVLSIKIYKT